MALYSIGNDSIIASFSILGLYGSSGYMLTYNISSFTRLSETYTNNFPSNSILLSDKTLLHQYYLGLNEQIYNLPNLTVLQTITLDKELQQFTHDPVTNNRSSYYISTISNGVYFFSNLSNSIPSFNFGKNLTITLVGPLNNNDAFLDF